MGWTTEDIGDQAGRVAIVTGANSGIGFVTARELARRGAHVVLACRNQDKGRAAVEELEALEPSGTVELASLDLSDLASIEAFAKHFLETHDRLDLLINNAGVMMPPLGQNADGFELQFGTNHLGHFALTGRLLERLTATEGARVVTVSSIAHRMGKIDFDNLNAERKYKKTGAYAQSKLANLMFAQELQRRLAASGVQTLSVAAHPGYTSTNLQTGTIYRWFNPLMAQGVAKGALPTLYAATSPEAAAGEYYGPRGWMEVRGLPSVAHKSKRSQDPEVASRLWAVSEELTGVKYLS